MKRFFFIKKEKKKLQRELRGIINHAHLMMSLTIHVYSRNSVRALSTKGMSEGLLSLLPLLAGVGSLAVVADVSQGDHSTTALRALPVVVSGHLLVYQLSHQVLCAARPASVRPAHLEGQLHLGWE